MKRITKDLTFVAWIKDYEDPVEPRPQWIWCWLSLIANFKQETEDIKTSMDNLILT